MGKKIYENVMIDKDWIDNLRCLVLKDMNYDTLQFMYEKNGDDIRYCTYYLLISDIEEDIRIMKKNTKYGYPIIKDYPLNYYDNKLITELVLLKTNSD